MKLFDYKILLANLSLLPINIAHANISNDLIKSWLGKDGYIVLSEPIKLDKLDPILSINAHSKFTLPLIFESLITINAKQELQPVLAKSWQISPDGKSIIITLKQNHRFSDNSEVTAKEVLHSIIRLCSPGSQEYGELQGLIGCEEHAKSSKALPQAYAIEKYKIKFNISASPTTFLYQLSSPDAVITKKSVHGLIGSAPYQIRKQHSDYLILDRNLYYYGDVSVKNNGIILFYLSGPNLISVVDQLKPHGALMYRMKELSNFNDDQYKLINSNPNITEILVLNNQRFPFNEPLVRKALSSSIYNRFSYACIPGAHKPYGIIPSGIGGSLNNMAPKSLPEISPEAIFKVIPKLKYKKVSVTIHQLSDLKTACESEQIIEAAKKINIDIKFKYHKDYSDLLPLYINHQLDGFIDLYIFKNREAYKIFEFFTKSGENDANIKQNTIDDMLKEAIAMPSSHGRFQIYHKLAQYIQDNNIVIPIFYMDHGNLMHKCLSGISDDFFFNPFLHLPMISKTKACET